MTTTIGNEAVTAPAREAMRWDPHRDGADRFRSDIQGLRAVAVVLVVLNHAGVPAAAGGYVGVDVFFVISGFLITSLLLRELGTNGRISIRRFYARRVSRLLPAATLVSICTLIGVLLWMSPLQAGEYARDAVAAAIYSANLLFMLNGTDYLALGNAPSPFQHFWSLAVEEQFYLVWPLAIICLTAAWRRIGRKNSKQALTVLMAIIVFGSFALSVTETSRYAPSAYFGTQTRAWELGVGVLISLSARRIGKLPLPWVAPLGWVGLVTIVIAALAFDDQTAFPGWLAAIPVLGAAAVISAGIGNQVPKGAGVVLGTGPMQAIGRLSYSWIPIQNLYAQTR